MVRAKHLAATAALAGLLAAGCGDQSAPPKPAGPPAGSPQPPPPVPPAPKPAAPAPGPAISEARAREIALKELAAKHPHTKWRFDRLEPIEGRIWRGRAGDAEPKPAMSAADVEVDAQTGQVTKLTFIPGR